MRRCRDLATDPRSQGGGALGRPDGCAGRERRQAAGIRARQSWLCPGPPRHDPTRLALSAVSKEQRTGAMVAGPHGRSPCRHAQNDDRRTRAQAARRTLVICHHGRDAGGRRLTRGRPKGVTEASIHSAPFSARGGFSADCRIDDPRWREPVIRTWHRCRPEEWAPLPGAVRVSWRCHRTRRSGGYCRDNRRGASR
jgi:hypothetical protein